MKLYRLLYLLPGRLVLSDGTGEIRVDELRDRTREEDGEYTLANLPDGRRAICRLESDGRPALPGAFVEMPARAAPADGGG